MHWIVVRETQVHIEILWKHKEGVAAWVPQEAAYKMKVGTKDFY